MGFQTDYLTHKNGQIRNPWEKEFIDFEFDGKHLSDFGLVAISDSDRIPYDHSPIFTDETSSVNGVVGQYFWGTKIGAKTRTFSLATDGMTEKQLNDFQYHFRPGRYGKFIEDTFAARESYCRINSVINLKFVPFQEPVKIVVGEKTYTVHKNLYKGEATISFVWDYPYSKSRVNYIEDLNENFTEEDIYAAARAVTTNAIPLSKSWDSSFLTITNSILGFAKLGVMLLGENSLGLPCHLGSDKMLLNCWVYNEETKEYSYDGGKLIEDNGHMTIEGVDSDKMSNKLIFYNPSQADAPCTIEMTIQPQFTPIDWHEGGNTPIFINNIIDKYNYNYAYSSTATAKKLSSLTGSVMYNTIEASNIITREYNTKVNPPRYLMFEEDVVFPQQFHYTTPNVINQVHKSISIAYDMFLKSGGPTSGQTSLTMLTETLRLEITHDAVLKWAMAALNGNMYGYFVKDNNMLDNAVKMPEGHQFGATWLNIFNVQPINEGAPIPMKLNWFQYFNALMLYFFALIREDANITELSLDESYYISDQIENFVLTFDGIRAETRIKYNQNGNDKEQSNLLTSFSPKSYIVEEICGDAILSPYLKLGGGNTLNEDGTIESCYCLGFRQGGQLYNVPQTKLKYDFIYIQ